MNIPASDMAKFQNALPFWLSLGLIPLAWIGAVQGGWTVFLLPLVTWYLFSALDAAVGLDLTNGDLEATDDDLYWYRLITMIWTPLPRIDASKKQIRTAFGGHPFRYGAVFAFSVRTHVGTSSLCGNST